MYKFRVNGKEISTEKNIKLLPFLRDELEITSVKDGCSEGACGTCTVLIDGKATKACIISTDKLEGKNILTVDGIEKKEMKIYEWAFAEAGAVQCGYCIPGMVICAKGLLDINKNPSEDEIKKAIRGNICRCTGYTKIVEAIQKVAKIFREGFDPKDDFTGKVGERLPRIDAAVKTSGEANYVADIKVDDLHYGGALRTKYPRALIKKIDISKAKEVSGVIGVFTAKDVLGKRNIGHLEFISDWDALIDEGEITRYIGDAVALVAAKTKEALKNGLAAIVVDYEELPVIENPKMALATDAPKIHAKGNVLFQQKLSRGNVDEAIAKAKHVVTHTYNVPFTEHACMEPESALAIPTNDGVHLYTGDQSIHDSQREVARLLGIEEEKVHVTAAYVGGGFGGKEDMSVQHHAGMMSYLTKKPIQVTLSRQESLNVSVKRHAMEIEMTHACDENGILLGMKCNIISDTGAYASLGGPVLQRACTHASGPYNYHNIEVLGTAVYTNNVPAGAFRGFGVTQSAFATEANLNELAKLVGISEWEIRFRNAIEPGLVLPNGQIADKGTALKETLLVVKDVFEKNKSKAGIACAFKNAGIGVGLPDIGRAIISVEKGKLHVRSGVACIGQGFATIALQMVCEATGLKPSDIIVEEPDTIRTPDSGTTTASRQTVFSGEAVKVAAKKLNEVLGNKKISEIEGQEFYGEYSGITDKMGIDKENPVSHIAYGYATQVAIIDDEGKITKIIAAHDVGKAINPIAVEGQIEGGVVMGLGYALTENFTLTKGIPNQKYGTLGLLRATDVPEIESIIIEKNTEDLAYGAKGVGEITTIPTAPAVQGAYYKLDGKFRTSLPLENTFYRKAK
ncbi:MAG: selenium-dependent xanthine dehydrogenase [Fusobacteriaceae bacterium]